MSENLKRVTTSIPLFIILYIAFNNFYFFLFLIFILYFFITFEFYKILNKIIKKKLNLFITLFISNIYFIFFSLIIFLNFNNNLIGNKLSLLFCVSICIATDIGGYTFGKFFKGKKLTQISPNKTYSGMIGSFFLSLLIYFIFLKLSLVPKNYFFLTILLSAVSQIGDISMSYLKRKSKVKDTGSILPGHGGILDRIDGILVALPLGILIIYYLN